MVELGIGMLRNLPLKAKRSRKFAECPGLRSASLRTDPSGSTPKTPVAVDRSPINPQYSPENVTNFFETEVFGRQT